MNEKKAERVVEVYTADRYLFQKIRLAAPDGVAVTHGNSGIERATRLVDIDTSETPLPDREFISMSRTQESADIRIPFSIEELCELLSKTEKVAPLTLSERERCVFLHGEKIRLTDVEFHLMSELFYAGGEYKGREELLHSVWDKNTDPGTLNVYVHYLREKLEGGGEKIILSSRKCGYKISEKYIGGGKI